ncbi:hypothetical protein [Actinorugispora endophytica]|uniref:Uncharacterized protein n=1 Tax=Actinorugispora endophytica TaxID=1605990 RepID=A0A4R6V2M2_9ACTN|nr:hypothetical protein [Actinorugispora endophytica]TDQ52377.1 hypothetical protein EV190_10614 [Actinorugispora endophytica]
MKLLMASGIAATALVLVAGPAAADGSVTVVPREARPGSAVVLESSCVKGAKRLEYTSQAFAGTATVSLQDNAGSAHATLKNGLAPGVYEVRGECKGGPSDEVVRSEIVVVEDDPSSGPDAVPAVPPTPAGAPQSGGGGTYQRTDPTVPLATLAGGLLVVAGVGLVAYRRAVRHGR